MLPQFVKVPIWGSLGNKTLSLTAYSLPYSFYRDSAKISRRRNLIWARYPSLRSELFYYSKWLIAWFLFENLSFVVIPLKKFLIWTESSIRTGIKNPAECKRMMELTTNKITIAVVFILWVNMEMLPTRKHQSVNYWSWAMQLLYKKKDFVESSLSSGVNTSTRVLNSKQNKDKIDIVTTSKYNTIEITKIKKYPWFL